MRYDAEHKARTRERVLVEAARAIRADGPHRLAVAGVMAKAGLTHGGFYAHFASRDDLVTAGVEQMFKEGQQRLLRTIEGKGPRDALIAYIDFYLSAAHRDLGQPGCPLPILSAEATRLPGDARIRYAAGAAALTGAIGEWLAAIDLADPLTEAASALAEMVGAIALARAEPDPARSDLILTRSRLALKRRLGLETAA